MKPWIPIAGTIVSIASLAGCDGGSNSNSETNTGNISKPAAPDNTANNKRDADNQNKTPMDQSNSSADIDITAKVRQAIVDDKALSTNAHNCKVITDKGVVTLRGVVDSDAERDLIETKAKAVPGVVRVDNQLEVKKPS